MTSLRMGKQVQGLMLSPCSKTFSSEHTHTHTHTHTPCCLHGVSARGAHQGNIAVAWCGLGYTRGPNDATMQAYAVGMQVLHLQSKGQSNTPLDTKCLGSRRLAASATCIACLLLEACMLRCKCCNTSAEVRQHVH